MLMALGAEYSFAKEFKSEDCKNQIKENSSNLSKLISVLQTKNMKLITKYFDNQLYFANHLDEQEAAYFINEVGDKFSYNRLDFEYLLFDTKKLKERQPSLNSFSEVFSTSNINNIVEYQNYCSGGQLNRAENGKYFDTPAIIAKYKDVSYNLMYEKKKDSFRIIAIYFTLIN
ncbi:hypothetical protein LEP1GSC061_1034 [Leptospira wolffii serovar Khorat str. Khorat-H2]|nr:hypothetical protein LEP1GSC061_1034 [Leptospira wolffii serovar Khorat str. Khorat-H2]